MLFSSVFFLLTFLPLTLCTYYLLKDDYRNSFLFLASLLFYSWGDPVYLFLILISIVTNYFLARFIDESTKHASIFLGIGIVFNLALIAYFKYSAFLVENINTLFHANISFTQVALPIGISFYTFQSISYIIDVYRKNAPVQRNIINYGLYISLFPQLIAGPIVRYKDVNDQIKARSVSLSLFASGAQRFIIGLSKKVLLANVLAETSDTIFSNSPEAVSSPAAWLGIICYTFQIYFDFSGYSDMAIGLGKMFGFTFMENFNFPYIANSIKDFWRRWHISLSTWFRDYLYIPLGGNRHGKFITYRNLLIVFFLTGLWHGASWNFVVWGLYHGFFLTMERILPQKKPPIILSHMYTLFVIIIGWVFFRSENLPDALSYLRSMFGLSTPTPHTVIIAEFLTTKLYWALGLATIFSIPLHFKNINSYPAVKLISHIALIILLILSLASLSTQTYNPFIYYRF